MTRRYKVMLPLTVHTADAAYQQGDEFDHDFTVEDEAANLASGLLELLPLRYRVVGESIVYDTPPGGEFERALPLGEEQLLVAGRAIEPVVEEQSEPAVKADAEKKKPAGRKTASRTDPSPS